MVKVSQKYEGHIMYFPAVRVTIIGQRFKQSGMEWSVRGANAIISLRCTSLSERFEDFGESRVA
uniref:Uncharacterized protein n=2 Tax=environmental samples TaxID=67798 RepID=D9MP62_9BACT|nr:unknown protein [uncultured Nitrospirae bacterium MY2-1F]ADI87751.1 unknown protein [uncultured Nitrospirae bacterium MY3-11A]